MVITLDKRKKPLGFCTERRARKLLEKASIVTTHSPSLSRTLTQGKWIRTSFLPIA